MGLSTAHLRYLFQMAARPRVAVFMLGAAALYTIFGQMHQQNLSDSPESTVHPYNPVFH